MIITLQGKEHEEEIRETEKVPAKVTERILLAPSLMQNPNTARRGRRKSVKEGKITY